MRERRVFFVCFPGCEILDVTGPASVFGSASQLLGGGAYRVELAAQQAGPVRTSCGVQLIAERAVGRVRGPIDTLMVVGGLGPAIRGAEGLVPSLPRLARRARRTASVCSGAFLLAQAGLLRGKRAATHWAGVSALTERYPDTRVEADPIYVRDGDVWTSAGVTSGIDLALALVEEDHGSALALEVARWGVMYLRRPGGQCQFSAPLQAQLAQGQELAGLLGWIADNLHADLSIEALARRARMSARNFARVFRRETGSTPAMYVEALRLEAARHALELGTQSVKQIASATGFDRVETLHRVFQRRLSVTPLQYRARFATLERAGVRQSLDANKARRARGRASSRSARTVAAS